MISFSLNFPRAAIRLRHPEGTPLQLWDPLRRKWLVVTPEEWVRQNMLHYFVGTLHYEPLHLCQEYPVTVCGQSQRADVVLFDRAGKPYLVVECKAPSVKIDAVVLQQLIRYNVELEAPYIAVTNGREHYCMGKDSATQRYLPMKMFPTAPE